MISDSSMEERPTKEGWSTAIMEGGGQYVITSGTIMMLW